LGRAMFEPVEVVRRMQQAFNARHHEGFLGLMAEDVEFRNPMGNSKFGLATAQEFMRANEEMGVHVETDGKERVDDDRVAVPIIMRMADGTELSAAAVFDVRDAKISLFWVVMDRASVGL
jgi:ketosteroid isomerase-like protein